MYAAAPPAATAPAAPANIAYLPHLCQTGVAAASVFAALAARVSLAAEGPAGNALAAGACGFFLGEALLLHPNNPATSVTAL